MTALSMLSRASLIVCVCAPITACERRGASDAPERSASPKAPPAAPSWVAEWRRDAGHGVTHLLTLRDDGRFGFLAAGAKRPISRAMGRWERAGERLTFRVDAHEPPEQPFPYGAEWTGAQVKGRALTAGDGAMTLTWAVHGPAGDRGLWSVTPPAGVALMAGAVTVAGSPPTDVLAVYYVANNHPSVDLETADGHRLTLYEAPTTDRLMLTVDPAFVVAAGVKGVVSAEKYGAYVPLAEVSMTATPASGLRSPPLRSLQVRGIPVAKMSGPGSSRGDRPEDALIRIDLSLTVTKTAGTDPRAARLLRRAAPQR